MTQVEDCTAVDDSSVVEDGKAEKADVGGDSEKGILLPIS